ncbi:hypothetical protein J7399_13085 [Shimia sp. R9_1]|uniref:hypothetical protein n=1 Tax=unclassified Shimia TaxID=2630038 RepID=UPI001ADAAFFA|nr:MULTISPECIES: hypothetical protein [unclassified Shimia]MBO9397134.1 hypothetical protein [Shimia sp. R9_2]MBO9403111.1 hypothetical protein [Shimia sp. R9_3]MBO9408367.1 hypothetical protein [Shimia sp. R9_1]
MSSSLETLAAKLAEDTLKAQKELGDERLFVEVGNMLAASSQSLEEAFLTEIRVRMSEEKARAFLVNKVKAARAAKAAAETKPT